MTITEAQRTAAIVYAGIEGGDGEEVAVNVLENGLQDIGQNKNLDDEDNTVTETRDTVLPVTVVHHKLRYRRDDYYGRRDFGRHALRPKRRFVVIPYVCGPF
jgi:hypothetical protein